MNKANKETSTKNEAQKFVKENWQSILAASGTLAGAAIFLLIKFYKKRRAENGELGEDSHLDALQDDALGNREKVQLLLDLGPESRAAIPNFNELVEELKSGVDDDRLKEILDTIQNIK